MAGEVRFAVGRLWYEGNSFNPIPARLDAFRAREWAKGPEALARCADTATELGAVAEFLRERPRWRAEVLRCTSAPPGGPVLQADLEVICDEIVGGLAGRDWDAVYLSLHGALIGTGDLAPDRTLLARVRAALGPDVPLAVSFDMHGCLAPGIADSVQILTGYRTYPHVDMFATAMRALMLLERAVAGEIRPRVTLAPVPMLPASHLMRTDAGPMAELVALAAEEERAPGIHDVTVFGGFAYADTPNAHATVAICHEAGADAGAIARRLADAVLARRERFRPDLPDAAGGIGAALRAIAAGARWPVAVVEPADNPLSGGIGDTTALLRAWLDAGSALPAVFCFFHDPALVARAHAAGEGAAIDCMLGGRVAPEFGPPIPFRGRVARLTAGRFVNTGPMERGMAVDLGRTAVLEDGPLKVVIAETCQSANDPGWCDLHGIDPASVAVFMAKAKNHFHAAFGPLCGAIVAVDTPGPAPADLRRLDYVHVPRSFLLPDDAG